MIHLRQGYGGQVKERRKAQGAGRRERLKTEDKKGARPSHSTLLRVVGLSNEAQGAGKD